MKCPNCKEKMKIIDSRPLSDDCRYRVYKCSECFITMTSYEELNLDTSIKLTEEEKAYNKKQNKIQEMLKNKINNARKRGIV